MPGRNSTNEKKGKRSLLDHARSRGVNDLEGGRRIMYYSTPWAELHCVGGGGSPRIGGPEGQGASLVTRAGGGGKEGMSGGSDLTSLSLIFGTCRMPFLTETGRGASPKKGRHFLHAAG